MLEKLEEFQFQLNRRTVSEQRFQRDVMHLTALKNLKVLKLNCNNWQVGKLIDEFVQKKMALEFLELADGLLDLDAAAAIAKLNTLNVLKLNCMNIVHQSLAISLLATGLSELEEFHIATNSWLFQSAFMVIILAENL